MPVDVPHEGLGTGSGHGGGGGQGKSQSHKQFQSTISAIMVAIFGSL